MQVIIGLVALVCLVLAAGVFGWLTVAILAALAVWPIFGISLGVVDHLFFGWSHQVVRDPTDPALVVGTYHMFHYGTLGLIALVTIGGAVWVVRRL